MTHKLAFDPARRATRFKPTPYGGCRHRWSAWQTCPDQPESQTRSCYQCGRLAWRQNGQLVKT